MSKKKVVKRKSNLFGEKYSVEQKGRVQDHYKIKEKLGQGTYATVRLAIGKEDGKAVAIKIIKKRNLDELECVLVVREIEIMRKLSHRHVVQLYDLFETKHHLYLIMEVCTGGELFDRVIECGHFNELMAAQALNQICVAMSYMHANNIIHRDLKPENLLYAHPGKKSIIKVTDFGLAKILQNEDDSMFTSCGTLYYVAPEILQSKSYTKAVDLWSLGVIAYVLLSGTLPFYSEDDSQTKDLIKSSALTFPGPVWGATSDSAKQLVRALLNRDASKRPTIDDVLDHPWIKSKETVAKTVKLSQHWHSSLALYNRHRKTVSVPPRGPQNVSDPEDDEKEDGDKK